MQNISIQSNLKALKSLASSNAWLSKFHSARLLRLAQTGPAAQLEALQSIIHDFDSRGATKALQYLYRSAYTLKPTSIDPFATPAFVSDCEELRTPLSWYLTNPATTAHLHVRLMVPGRLLRLYQPFRDLPEELYGFKEVRGSNKQFRKALNSLDPPFLIRGPARSPDEDRDEALEELGRILRDGCRVHKRLAKQVLLEMHIVQLGQDGGASLVNAVDHLGVRHLINPVFTVEGDDWVAQGLKVLSLQESEKKKGGRVSIEEVSTFTSSKAGQEKTSMRLEKGDQSSKELEERPEKVVFQDLKAGVPFLSPNQLTPKATARKNVDARRDQSFNIKVGSGKTIMLYGKDWN